MSIVKSGRWLFVASGLAVLAIAASILLAAIPAAAAQSSGSGATGMPRTITVVGTGTAAAAPDLATVQIGIDTQSSAPEEAVRQNDEKMEALIAALKAAGIEDSDIQTSYYSLYAEQRYDPATGQPTGEFTYRVSSGVSVKVRDLDQVGAILSDAVAAGANNISGVSFSIEDTSALQAAAREEAMADAQARAESLAQLSGVSLGEVVVVSEVITGAPGPLFYEVAARQMGGGGGAPIQPGQLEVGMQVQVSYAIQ